MAKKTAEQKAQVNQTKSAGKAEIIALKQSGADKTTIQAEKRANKQEVKDLERAFATGTYTPLTDLSGVRSTASAYGGDLATNVNSLLDSASAYYTQYGIPTVTKKGNTTIGVGLDQLVNYNLGNASGSINRLMNNAESYVGKTLTADELASAGIKIKQDPNNPGAFVSKVGGDTKTFTYFTQNPDGTYTGVGVNRASTPSQDGGLFGSTLGKIALGLGSFYLGPLVGGLAGLGGGTLAGTLGGALVGGAGNVLGGGKFGPGALIGGGAGFAGGGGFEGLLGGNAAPIVDATYASNVPVIEGLTAVQPTVTSLGAGVTGAPIVTSGVESVINGVPITSYDIPFDPKAYADYAGLGGAIKGISNLGSAIGSTIGGTISSMFGGGFGGGLLGGGGVGNYIAGNLINQALAEEQMQQQAGGGYAGAAPDYSGLINLLAPRIQPRFA